MVVPRCGLHSITFPRPASSSIKFLIALTAPSLFPLSRKRLATRRALMCSTFPGRRQLAASERSSVPGPVLTGGPAVVDMCTHNSLHNILQHTSNLAVVHQWPLENFPCPPGRLHVASRGRQSSQQLSQQTLKYWLGYPKGNPCGRGRAAQLPLLEPVLLICSAFLELGRRTHLTFLHNPVL